MKKIIAMLLIVGFAFSSCDDYLDSTNYTEADTGNFPTNATDVSQLLAALYAVMNQLNNDPLQCPWFVTEIMSDNCYGAGGTGDNECKAVEHFTLYSETQYDEMWKLYYRGIYRANTVIATIDNADWEGDTDARDQALGEAYFMRALFYLWATQSFGDIPFITSTNVPDPCPQVSAEDEIYPQILSDLVSGAELMNTQSDGHANKYAAEALLARAYLYYEGFYKKIEDISSATPSAVELVSQEGVENTSLSKSDVVTYVEDVISNGGYSLVEDFRLLWQYTNELTIGDYSYTQDLATAGTTWAGNGNEEEIFMVQYMNSSNWSAEYAMAYSNQTSLYCSLRCSDNGYENTFPFGQGWGQGLATANLWDEWSDDDMRKQASIIDCQNELEGYVFVSDCCEDAGYANKKYCAVTCKEGNGKTNDWSALSTWWCYTSDYSSSSNGNDMQGAHYEDTYLIRLADVYLMHSELTGDATYMNKVRARAGLEAVSSYSLSALQDERRFELAFEGLRYNDLRRWSGKDCDASALVCTALDKQAGYSICVNGSTWQDMKHMNSSWSARYVATNGFLPIPSTQINLVADEDVLKQNDGWSGSDAAYTTLY